MTIAERVDALFKTITRPNGKKYSYRDIARLADGAVTATTIWKLRTGLIKNPTYKVLEALSEVFGIHPAFFFDKDVTADAVPQYQAMYREREGKEEEVEKMARQIALRASQLDEKARQDILEMIEYVRKAQELDRLSPGEGDEQDEE